MFSLRYPQIPFRLKEEEGKRYVFDDIRKCWLIITPEEWVRQHFVHYLLLVKQYPATLIAVEKSLRLGELTKRFDILVYDRNHRPWLMVECKAMHIPLNQPVLDQILRYNIALPVPYMAITNGSTCAVFDKQNGKLGKLEDLPLFPS